MLFCSDLLDLICQNCDLHTLSQLSLTNRTISDSAIHVLWSSIKNFGPLIRCMPEDLWEECPSTSSSRTRSLSFLRPIQDTDYERFLLRAAHVRKFGGASGTITYQVKRDALLALCHGAGKNIKLLPQVRSLIFPREDQNLSCVGHYLSPAITHVDIYPFKESLLSLLPTIISQCPSITEARLIGFGRVSMLTRTVSLMHQWSHLRSLVVSNSVDVYGLSNLSSLPALKILTFVCGNHHPLDPISKIPKGFPALDRLVFDHCKPDFCVALMRYMDQVPMKSISVTFGARISPDVWFDLLNTMRDGVVHDQIRSVHLDGADWQILDQVETIFPLLCYTNLSSIHLKSLQGFNFNDDVINAMASSWKELRKFRVETMRQPSAYATYKSLVSLARHNPRLEELAILFDATTITKDILSARPWKGIRNQSLRLLDVRCSPIETPDLVADFLTDIFPKSIGVSVDFDPRRPVQRSYQLRRERWTEVERLLRADSMGQ